MRVEIEGLQQGSIEVELQILPRIGETIKVMYGADAEVKGEVEKRMPQMRDAILLLIGNKTYEELQDLQGKKQLKAEITSKINSFLKVGKVKAVYFTNFVVQ